MLSPLALECENLRWSPLMTPQTAEGQHCVCSLRLFCWLNEPKHWIVVFVSYWTHSHYWQIGQGYEDEPPSSLTSHPDHLPFSTHLFVLVRDYDCYRKVFFRISFIFPFVQHVTFLFSISLWDVDSDGKEIRKGKTTIKRRLQFLVWHRQDPIVSLLSKHT